MLEQATTIINAREPEPATAPDAILPPVSESPYKQRIIAVTSGKGGVGKTNITANMGIALTRFGHRVMMLDTDFGLGNLDLLLGITPKYNLTHVFSGKKQLQDIMLTGPSGVKILPAGSGGKRPAKIDLETKEQLMAELRLQQNIADIILIDTRAGLSDNTIHFLTLADEIILVTTPEPPSIMDSYGIVKILAQERESTLMHLIVNMASTKHDALHVEDTIGLVTKQFFNVTMENLGWICFDPGVSRAVRRQQPFVMLFPHSRATRDLTRLAAKFVNHPMDLSLDQGFRGFINRLRQTF